MYQRIWEGKDIDEKVDLENNLKHARALNYKKGISDALVELARSTNSPDVANQSFQEARELCEQSNDKNGLIKVFFHQGMYLVQRGIEKFGNIFKQFQIALQFAIEENQKYYIAQIHHGIGEAFLRLGNLREARHHFEISLQIFQYLQNDRKILTLLVSIADVEVQFEDNTKNSSSLKSYYQEYRNHIEQIQSKIPLTDRFYHLSRFSDLFLELDEFREVNDILEQLEKLLRDANLNSSLYFQGKMALALIKGNLEMAKLNLTSAEELYNYILRRRIQARITDLYGALISLAVISIYKFRIFFDISHLSTAQNLIQDAIKISEETDHIRGYIRASMVDAMLKMTLKGAEEDLSEIEKVLQIAQEKGLNTEVRLAQQELSRFKKNISLQQNAKSEDRTVAEVLWYALEAKRIVRKSQ